MKQRYRVDVEVYVGQHDFSVTVQANDEEEAKEKAWLKVADDLSFDDFSQMTITATHCEPVAANKTSRP